MDPKNELTKIGRSARSVKNNPQTMWSNKGSLHSDVPASRPGFDIRQKIKSLYRHHSQNTVRPILPYISK